MKTFLNETNDLYPNGMLKVDVNICKKHLPNVRVKHYTCSDVKMIRNVVFENDTIMLIESQCMEGEFWNQLLDLNNKFTPNLKINLINKIVDKGNRKIYIYNVSENKNYSKR